MSSRLGIVGAGTVAGFHADAARAAGVDVAACCDVDIDRARRLAGQHDGAVACSALEELLEIDGLGGVVVAVPNHLHREVAIGALRGGKHVLLEKPMAMSIAECDEVIEAAEANDRFVQMGFVSRGSPTSVAVRSMIDAGRLGRIYHAKAFLHRHRGIPGLGRWFTSRERSGGGVIVDLGVHLVDLVMFLAGFPAATRVSADCTSHFGAPIDRYLFDEMWAGPPDPGGTFDVEDGGVAMIRFEDGLTLSLSVSWADNLPAAALPDGVVLFGTRGGCRFDVWGSEVHVSTEQDGYMLETTPRIEVAEPWSVAWRRQHEAFARTMSGAPPAASALQGRAVQTVLDGIYRSSAAGHEVEL